MVTRNANWPEGTPCWVDLGVDDFGRAQAFYAELFGWDIEPGAPEHGGYTSCTRDGHRVAGLAPKPDPSQPTAWTVYLASDDVGATLGRVRDHGGQVVMEPMEIADMGRMAMFTDPEGAFVGLWEGGSHTGFELANDPGSVTWNESYSRDWQRNRSFYADVFGYTYEDIPAGEVEYATVSVQGRMVGGIGRIGGTVPEQTPPHWNVYFKVEDADAALETVARLGGSVMGAAFDSAYGRMGRVADDQGATFWVMADLRR